MNKGYTGHAKCQDSDHVYASYDISRLEVSILGSKTPNQWLLLPKRTEISITTLQKHEVSACIQVWELSITPYNTLYKGNLWLSCKVVPAWYFSTATILNDMQNINSCYRQWIRSYNFGFHYISMESNWVRITTALLCRTEWSITAFPKRRFSTGFFPFLGEDRGWWHARRRDVDSKTGRSG